MRIPAKKLSPILLALILTALVITLTRCEKEAPSMVKPSIKLSAAKHTVCVGAQVPISVQLEGIDHRFHIVAKDSKKGVIRDQYGKEKTDWNTNRSQRDTFYFTAMEASLHKISFRATDDANQSASDTLELTVKPHSFKVEARTQREKILISESSDVRLHIEDKIDARFPKRLSCQSELEGTFTIEGQPCSADVPVFIGAKSDIAIRFKAEKSGRTKLRFTVSDTDKKTQTVSTQLTVEDPTFTVKPTAEQRDIYVNKTATIRLEIKGESDTQKTLSCYSDSGGSFTVEGKPCKANTPISIGTKTKINDIAFKPAKTGMANLRFILHDKYQNKEGWVDVNAKPVPFDVKLTAASDQGHKLSSKGTITVKILTRGIDTSGITYSLSNTRVEGTGKGTLSAYPTEIKADKGADLTYTLDRKTGEEPEGEHKIAITVADSYGQSTTKEINFDVVVFPTISNADLYYRYKFPLPYEHSINAKVWGKQGDYQIVKERVRVYNCQGKKGAFTVDKTYDYNPEKVYKVYSIKARHDKYEKDCGCVTGEAQSTFWLIDKQKHVSRPVTVTMRKR